MKKAFLYILMISCLMIQTSCLLLVAGAGAGGYVWYNGRVDKDIKQDKNTAYNVAKAYLKSKKAVFTIDRKSEGKLEGEIPGAMKNGKRDIYKISFEFYDFEPLKPKDPKYPTADEAKQMKEEKGLKTRVVFKFTDGINPTKAEAEKYFNEYLNKL